MLIDVAASRSTLKSAIGLLLRKSLEMPVVYRPARVEDLEQAGELIVSSINDLTERHGFGRKAVLRPPIFQLFSLRDDPDGLWVAEDAGQIRGFAFSWVCGDLWFLAQLFVSPSHQGRGIGNELLKRTLEHAQKSGTANKALITFTFNRVSQGLYIRHGLFPRLPIYDFNVAREVLMGRLQEGQLRYSPLEDTASNMHRLAQIDIRALGVSREKHHRYLINDSPTRGVILYSGDDCVGYVYVSLDGHIGPLAVAEPNALGAAFRTALKLAAESGSSQVSAFLPGTSDTALSIAVEHGMRITFPMVLMSTRDFGNWAQYLPRNPAFM
jgi:ribosomal protein S18 acetylase RimI-like enzyme